MQAELPLSIEARKKYWVLVDANGTVLQKADQGSELEVLKEQLTQILKRRQASERNENSARRGMDVFKEPAIGEKLAYGFRLLDD